MIGWVAKNAKVSVKDGALKIASAGKQVLLANAKVPARGPGVLRFRMRSPKGGKANSVEG